MAKEKKKQWYRVTFAETELKTYRVLATDEEDAVEEALDPCCCSPVDVEPDIHYDHYADPDGNCREVVLDSNQATLHYCDRIGPHIRQLIAAHIKDMRFTCAEYELIREEMTKRIRPEYSNKEGRRLFPDDVEQDSNQE